MGGRSRGAPTGGKPTGATAPDQSAQAPRPPAGRPSVTASAFVRQSWTAPATVTSSRQPAAAPSPAQRERGGAVDPPEAGRVAQAVTASGVGGCQRLLDEAEPQGLAVTYWINPSALESAGPGPYAVAVHIAGERIGVGGALAPLDQFVQEERVEGVTSAGGPLALTARVQGINAGTWRVTATARLLAAGAPASTAGAAHPGLPRQVSTVSTRFAQLAHGPAVRLAVWPSLVGVAVLVAVVIQGLLHARAHHPTLAAVAAALGASVIGYVSAKLYYLAVHREPLRTFMTAGTCIQGFLIGGIGSLTLAAAGFGLPVGNVLDMAAPAVFLGMAVGRPGCFFSGCCAGRPASSRWGLFSSDRRVAVRRIPVQLLEAVVALVIGVGALVTVLGVRQPTHGLVFVGAAAAYVLIRQLLFPLRADAHTRRGRRVALIGSFVVLISELALIAAR